MTLLSLPSDLGIESACTLHQQLARALHQSTALQVDASAVSRIHSACIQVLCAWAIARNQRGYKTEFSSISPVLSEALHVLGVAHHVTLTPLSSSPSTVKNNP